MAINKKEVSKAFLLSFCVSVLAFWKCIFQTLSCFLASHWYVLDTLLGYTLRIAPIGLYAGFWNQFTASNWAQHYFIILSWPWLPCQWTSQVNLLSILPLSWQNYPILFSSVSFYFLAMSFDHNRCTHYDDCWHILKIQL